MKGKLPKLLALVGGTALVASLTAGEFIVSPPAPPETRENHSNHGHVSSIDSLAEQQLANDYGKAILIPRTFIKDLPEDLTKEQNAARKKQAFANILLPLILRANERIELERSHILYLQGKMQRIGDISARDMNWLTSMCKRYKVRMGERPDAATFDAMLERVDIIPPSLALAQAAIESGWGTSRFAQQGNALFGQWTWDSRAQGMEPQRREEGKTHRIRTFTYLFDSVDTYMNNLNRNAAYIELRKRRKELRDHGVPLTGAALAPALLKYSERGEEYVNDVLSMINYNDYQRFDSAQLETV